MVRIERRKVECEECGREFVLTTAHWGTPHSMRIDSLCEDCYGKRIKRLEESGELSEEEVEETKEFLNSDEKTQRLDTGKRVKAELTEVEPSDIPPKLTEELKKKLLEAVEEEDEQ